VSGTAVFKRFPGRNSCGQDGTQSNGRTLERTASRLPSGPVRTISRTERGQKSLARLFGTPSDRAPDRAGQAELLTGRRLPYPANRSLYWLCSSVLSRTTMALLIFQPAAAGTRLVTRNFRYREEQWLIISIADFTQRLGNGIDT